MLRVLGVFGWAWLVFAALPGGLSAQSYGTSQLLAPVQWKLGVGTVNLTEQGVRITRVERGSAAERAGLEVGDDIFSVNGTPIGIYRGRVYDIGDVLNSRADRYGRVSLRVRDRNSGRMANVPAQLQSHGYDWGTGNVANPGGSGYPGYPSYRPPYVPPSNPDYAPPSYTPPSYTPPGYSPPSYSPPSYRPPSYQPPTNYPPSYSPPGSSSWPSGSTSGYWPSQPTISQADRKQIGDWYVEHLARKPNRQELDGWISELSRGARLAEVRVGVLASSEYFDRCRNSRSIFTQMMISQVMGRQPTENELNTWNDQLDRTFRGDRAGFVRDFLTTVKKY